MQIDCFTTPFGSLCSYMQMIFSPRHSDPSRFFPLPHIRLFVVKKIADYILLLITRQFQRVFFSKKIVRSTLKLIANLVSFSKRTCYYDVSTLYSCIKVDEHLFELEFNWVILCNKGSYMYLFLSQNRKYTEEILNFNSSNAN